MKPSPAYLALNAATAWIGPVRFHQLLQRFGSAGSVLKARAGQISATVSVLTPDQAQALLDFCAAFDAGMELNLQLQQGALLLAFDDPAYPARLRQIPDPPPLLYVKGQLPPPGAVVVAVVGTREPTEYGRRMARGIAAGLARAGVWVVSGLAKGIDAEAHTACLDAGGKTLAVLGTGLNKVYPAENKALAERIAQGGGALLSQFAMASGGNKMHFPMRNGVISGLSLGVVVVEGERDSGSLITAHRALDQDREVFAVPGMADVPQAQGPLELIQQGAKLVRSADEVLEELGLRARRPRSRSVSVALPQGPAALAALALGTGQAQLALDLQPGSPAEKAWLALQPAGRLDLDGLAAAAGLNAWEAAAAVTELELLGAVRQLPGSIFESLGAR